MNNAQYVYRDLRCLIDEQTKEPIRVYVPKDRIDDFDSISKTAFEAGRRMKAALTSSPIVKLGMETPSTFDPNVTVEQHAQDLRDFMQFKVAAEILVQNQKDCEQFEGRDGL
jgi:hypothetical protein